MGKPLRKYSTRDLEILAGRGKPGAQNELIARALAHAARQAPQPIKPERSRGWYSMANADTPRQPGPPHRSPSQLRRDAARMEARAAAMAHFE